MKDAKTENITAKAIRRVQDKVSILEQQNEILRKGLDKIKLNNKDCEDCGGDCYLCYSEGGAYRIADETLQEANGIGENNENT